MKFIDCASGVRGWQARLHSVYDSLAEFQAYDEIYGQAQRFGYDSAVACWRDNPVIEGSVNPSDLRKSKKQPKQRKIN